MYKLSEIEYDPDGNPIYYEKGSFRNMRDAWKYGKKEFSEFEIVDSSTTFGDIVVSSTTYESSNNKIFDNMVVLKTDDKFIYYSGKHSKKELSEVCIKTNSVAYQLMYSDVTYDGECHDMFCHINTDMSLSDEIIRVFDIQFPDYISGIEFTGFISCTTANIVNLQKKLAEIFTAYNAEFSFNLLENKEVL